MGKVAFGWGQIGGFRFLRTVNLNDVSVEAIVDKIVKARKFYGVDSSYVIGMMVGVESVLNNGDNTFRELQDLVVEAECNRQSGQKITVDVDVDVADDDDILAENTWTKGLVKWFNNDKGYGFISTDAETDVFVHWRDISSWDHSLLQGDKVEFMVTRTAKGFQGINVMKIESQNDNAESSDGVEKFVLPPDEAVVSVVDDTKEGEAPDGGHAAIIGSDEGDGVNQEQSTLMAEADEKNTIGVEGESVDGISNNLESGTIISGKKDGVPGSESVINSSVKIQGEKRDADGEKTADN